MLERKGNGAFEVAAPAENTAPPLNSLSSFASFSFFCARKTLAAKGWRKEFAFQVNPMELTQKLLAAAVECGAELRIGEV